MKANSVLTTQQLAAAAKEARGEKTQQEVAQLLGITKQSVSQAENPHLGTAYDTIRVRIIEALTPYTVERPLYRLVRKPADADTE